MQPSEIKAALAKKGINFSILAEATGHAPQRFSMIVNRTSKSSPIAKLVADALQLPFEQVFPDYAELKAKRKKRADTVEALRERLAG